MNIVAVAKVAGKKLITATKANLPKILIGIGIGGSIGAGVMAVKATPKALDLIAAKKKELGKDKLTPQEVIEATWKCYVPAVATEAVAVGCMVGSTVVNENRLAELAGAFAASQAALNSVKEETKAVLGEEKAREIEQSANEKQMENVLHRPVKKAAEEPDYPTMKYEIVDMTFGQHWVGTGAMLDKAIMEIRNEVRQLKCASLNQFYDFCPGAKHIDIGDQIGWKYKRDGMPVIRWEYYKDEDGNCYIGLEFRTAPVYDYEYDPITDCVPETYED